MLKSLSDFWQNVLESMSEKLSETTIKTWFDEVDIVTMEDSAIVLHCGNDFKKSVIETRFVDYIKQALKDSFSADSATPETAAKKTANRNRQADDIVSGPPPGQEASG